VLQETNRGEAQAQDGCKVSKAVEARVVNPERAEDALEKEKFRTDAFCRV